MLNKVWKAVYFESKFPTSFKRAVQWMAVGGYSYISPVYRNLRMSSRIRRVVLICQYCVPPLKIVFPSNFQTITISQAR